MERREFLKAVGLAGGAGLAAFAAVAAESTAQSAGAGQEVGRVGTESRKAWDELLALLAEADRRYLGNEWQIARPGDIADGHRYLMHVLHSGIEQWLEADPRHPVAKRFVNPNLKLLGDNPDAIYYTAPLDPTLRYRVRGNAAGAVYTSLTIEGGNADGGYPDRVAAALNDTGFDVAEDGSFEVTLGPDEQGRNRLALPPDTGTLTTRHYFENEISAAKDPRVQVRLEVEPLEPQPPPPTPDDARIAAGLRRVANYFRAATLGMPPRTQEQQPPWVSTMPNHFMQPMKWQSAEGGFGAVDNAYAMAPYVLGPDEALVIDGRWPKARFGSLVLWNRFMQTYDYVHRRVSLNRVQTRTKPDGSFRIILAHRDPGLPNWIDTEGRMSGLMFWRFQLPEEAIVRPRAVVVNFDELSA